MLKSSNSPIALLYSNFISVRTETESRSFIEMDIFLKKSAVYITLGNTATDDNVFDSEALFLQKCVSTIFILNSLL